MYFLRVTVCLCYVFYNFYATSAQGDPLYLTPYIKEGRLEEGRNAALVNLTKFGFGNITSYSGFLTVDAKFDSNLFFWYFPAFEQPEESPLLLWLQGGPGNSSLIGLFEEMGPFKVDDDMNISLRPNTWVRNISVIYLDNPVGAGYSFTRTGYVTNQTTVGNNLYNAVQQFFTLFPNLQRNDFYISGESYGGKYAPTLAHMIHQNNPSADIKINLQGLTIGNGFSDPPNMLLFSDIMYHLGLIDDAGKAGMDKHKYHITERIEHESWFLASEGFIALIESAIKPSGFTYFYNFLQPTEGVIAYRKLVIESDDFREAVHVGTKTFDDGKVYTKLFEDLMKSVAPVIDELLNHYRVLIYNGQLDICVPYISTVNFLKNINYSIVNGYNETVREKWYTGGELAGYVQEVGNLTQVLVRNAGHMVPRDQLDWSYEMITKFIKNESLVNPQ